MPNDFLSLWPSPRRSARLVEGTIELLCKMPLAALALLAASSLPGCGGEEDDGITYDDDVKPIFNQRCTTCHRPVSPIQVDIQNPYSPEVGLVNAVNSWWVESSAEARVGLDEKNVVPFDPDASFLMDKITDNLPEEGQGAAMPLQIDPLTPQEVQVLEDWVRSGAQPGPVFDNQVQPIFGSEDVAGFFSGKCVFCHYAGSPRPGLDLTDAFGPNGLVDIDATYRGDMKRVLPGDPENSLMILKVRAERAGSDIGAQMPYSFDALSTRQVDIVRQWILEGARP
jgi:hypothetical protein